MAWPGLLSSSLAQWTSKPLHGRMRVRSRYPFLSFISFHLVSTRLFAGSTASPSPVVPCQQRAPCLLPCPACSSNCSNTERDRQDALPNAQCPAAGAEYHDR
ncbi:hypothetical protein Mapa_009522 [Marchantia paleacea]|nr:hypothetical protein Mapa_009522 [Marchantia paleacea]